jgi:uncharacterized protein (DUF1499 family)
MVFLLLIPVLIVALAVAGAIGIRRSTIDPSAWHIDPTTAPPTGNPNWYRLTPDTAATERDASRDSSSPVFDVDVSQLAAAFDKVARADKQVEVLAGAADDGFATYVQRSTFFAFPDYASVTFVAVPSGGSTFSIFSRSQYGKSDLGVNEKRVKRWTDALTSELR